jgi:hypothetical protein
MEVKRKSELSCYTFCDPTNKSVLFFLIEFKINSGSILERDL